MPLISMDYSSNNNIEDQDDIASPLPVIQRRGSDITSLLLLPSPTDVPVTPVSTARMLSSRTPRGSIHPTRDEASLAITELAEMVNAVELALIQMRDKTHTQKYDDMINMLSSIKGQQLTKIRAFVQSTPEHHIHNDGLTTLMGLESGYSTPRRRLSRYDSADRELQNIVTYMGEPSPVPSPILADTEQKPITRLGDQRMQRSMPGRKAKFQHPNPIPVPPVNIGTHRPSISNEEGVHNRIRVHDEEGKQSTLNTPMPSRPNTPGYYDDTGYRASVQSPRPLGPIRLHPHHLLQRPRLSESSNTRRTLRGSFTT
jgi:hypothetical protein